MDKEIIKEYSNGELTVVWKPQTCIHAGECVKALPQVYNPKEKPWIKAENASTQELINQINKCPSGALSYYISNSTADQIESPKVQISASKNGPYLIKGEIELIKSDGSVERIDKSAALCRCGASKNKPFCDGSHRAAAFEG